MIGLFGEDAPQSVAAFKKVCDGSLRGRGGRTVGYAGSQAWRILQGERIDLGRVKQIDEINQSPGTPQRQLVLVEVPENNDANDITHDVAGTVSVKKGGGKFEFIITPNGSSAASLDGENVVIGRVLEGLPIVATLDKAPTNQKTPRDGFRKVGRLIGDGRAKLDVSRKVSALWFPLSSLLDIRVCALFMFLESLLLSYLGNYVLFFRLSGIGSKNL